MIILTEWCKVSYWNNGNLETCWTEPVHLENIQWFFSVNTDIGNCHMFPKVRVNTTPKSYFELTLS